MQLIKLVGREMFSRAGIQIGSTLSCPKPSTLLCGRVRNWTLFKMDKYNAFIPSRLWNRNHVVCYSSTTGRQHDRMLDFESSHQHVLLQKFAFNHCVVSACNVQNQHQLRFFGTKTHKTFSENIHKFERATSIKEVEPEVGDSNHQGSIKQKITDLPYDTILTVPNVLTTIRMVMAPILGYLVVEEAYSMACGVFMVAGITDLLDGYIARKFPNQTSALGSFIDPLADKMLISILFVSLAVVNLMPVALTVLVVSRDICLTTAGFYVRYISLNPQPKSLREFFDITNVTAKLQPTLSSKVNTAVQLSVVAFTLAAPVFNFTDHLALQALWYLTAATTVFSGVGYIFAKDTFKLLKQRRKKEQ